MAVTPADFKAIATQYSSETDDTINGVINRAERRVNRTAWGDEKADEGVIYLAAHLLTQDKEQDEAAPGPETQQSSGNARRAYQVPPPFAKYPEASTAWGRRYLELRQTVFADRRI